MTSVIALDGSSCAPKSRCTRSSLSPRFVRAAFLPPAQLPGRPASYRWRRALQQTTRQKKIKRARTTVSLKPQISTKNRDCQRYLQKSETPEQESSVALRAWGQWYHCYIQGYKHTVGTWNPNSLNRMPSEYWAFLIFRFWMFQFWNGWA